jgi:hypothetical protein
VVIQTDDKDEIAQIIKMKQHIKSLQGGSVVRFIILGGAEAWLVADHLAAEQIPVILAPPRCRPAFWGQRHCLSGKPMQDATGLDVLVAKGVLVGVASLDADDGYVRNLIWDAGRFSYMAGVLRFDNKCAHNGHFGPLMPFLFN